MKNEDMLEAVSILIEKTGGRLAGKNTNRPWRAHG